MVISVLDSRCSIGPNPTHKASPYPHNKFPILLKHVRNFSNMQPRSLSNMSDRGEPGFAAVPI